MKEKNKKILKGFGVGALACLGMFGLTGCANIDISQKKVDSLIERFENLSDKVTKEEVLNLCNNAFLDSMFYENGYDNVVISGIGDDIAVEMMIYSNSEMTIVSYVEGTGIHVEYYDVATGNMVDADFVLTRNGYVCLEKHVDSSFDNSRFGDSEAIAAWPLMDFNPESLVSYQLLENGNYSLLFVEEEHETIDLGDEEDGEYTLTNYITVEITKDAKLMSIKQQNNVDLHFDCDQQTWEEEFQGYLEDNEVTYSYGTVDVEFMKELYELAQAAEETPEEE